jgi:hypothetical protein
MDHARLLAIGLLVKTAKQKKNIQNRLDRSMIGNYTIIQKLIVYFFTKVKII